jgi:aminoglycoside phosphotransferase family enzyme/predicted kinase
MSDDDIPSGLLHAAAFPHPCERIELCETHLSWVILTGTYAYKIKKAVRFNFADFSTVEQRHHYCREELRLNRRLAASMYLDVVAINRSDTGIRIAGSGPTVDYAVKMRQFPASQLLSSFIETHELPPELLDGLADQIARFHCSLPAAPADSAFGSADSILLAARDNFETLEGILHEPWKSTCRQIRRKVEAHIDRQHPLFEERRAGGMIRECHGDLHLANMFLEHDQVTVFDGIEFNDDFRWIDIISEIAFTVMDFEDRGRQEAGWRLLNRWLEATGDYAGVRVLPFYLCYRAMVRAKVAGLQARGVPPHAHRMQTLAGQFDTYLHLAESYATRHSPAVIITSGMSGSGKSFHTQTLLERLPAIRVRSDVERRRVTPTPHSDDVDHGIDHGRYSPEATATVYQSLLHHAEAIVSAGLPAIVDATFLRANFRYQFRALAERLEIPFVILSFESPEPVLRARIRERRELGNDASEATIDILKWQIQHKETFGTDEQPDVITFTDTDGVLHELKQRVGSSDS